MAAAVAIKEPIYAPGAYQASDICERGAKAFQDFQTWHMLNQAIAEVFYPERADFTLTRTPGLEQYINLMDGEPTLMRRDLANQLGAMLRRRGAPWFEAKAFPRKLNKVDRVKKWCEGATQTMRDVIYAPRANFSEAMAQSDNDYVAFGASVVAHTYLYEDGRATGLIFKCLHLRDCAWYENQNGVVDEMYERIKLTLSQLVEKFGWDALPRELKDKHKNNSKEEVTILRCVLPVEKYSPARGKAPGRARYASIYVHEDTKHEFVPPTGERAFFRTWPYLVRRWMTVSGERFGRSPATSVALADARMLQSVALAIIESLEKLVNPPLLAPDEGVSEIAIRAGGMMTFDPEMLEATNGRPPITALEVGRPDYGMEFAAERRMFLGRAFFQNLLKLPPLDSGKMTATEVNERIEEYVRAAAPIFEPMEAENGALMEAVFERALDADGPANPWGAFEEGPDELAGAQVRFEFETPLSIAFRKLRSERARAVNAYIMERMQTRPEIVDLIDHDELDRAALEGIGEATWLVDQKEVDERRQQKALAAAAADMANAALQAQQPTGGGKKLPAIMPPDPLAAVA